MKRWILVVMALGAVAALGYYVNRPKAPLLAEIEPVTAASADRTIGVAPHPIAVAPVAQQIIQRPVDPPPPTQAALAARKEAGLKLVFNQAIETLLSPQASYDQKKAVWKQLKATGKLDEAVAELEQRVASDPNSADAATALGEGYYKEAGQTDDVREKAMLAMKADQTLEAALNLDPSSWDARFTKTVGMSYWPPELNKGQEVIDQFQALIQQQEGGPPQPRFADSYLRLGDQYQKAGNPDSANQVWQRGAALFPDNEELRGKLAPAPQPAP